MDYIYNSVNYVRILYSQVNPASLSGAIDVVVVEQPDGSYLSTPFHIRFGKYVVFNYEDKIVDIKINGQEIDLKMKLGENGVAFSHELDASTSILTEASISPIEGELILNDNKKRYDSGGASMSSDGVLSDEEISSADVDSPTYKRTLRLSSYQLKSLGLNYGSNEALFSITTKFQGTAICICNIYLYKWSEKLVISDIDGTITKSDVLGHVIPVVGGTWAHEGVAELYNHITSNNYRILYLSSRAIGMSHSTKNYLKNVRQGSIQLPDGPVLLSPTSVFMALRKEVIERRPDEFKIACLTELKALFPTAQPFFAGFGNRHTDVKSYLAVDIPPERIFIINPLGRVSCANRLGNPSDYSTIANHMVDYIFPPLLSPNSNKFPPFNRYVVGGEEAEAEKQLVENELDAYKQRSMRARKDSNLPKKRPLL